MKKLGVFLITLILSAAPMFAGDEQHKCDMKKDAECKTAACCKKEASACCKDAKEHACKHDGSTDAAKCTTECAKACKKA